MRVAVPAKPQRTCLHLSQRTYAGQRHMCRTSYSHTVSYLWVHRQKVHTRIYRMYAGTGFYMYVYACYWRILSPTAPPSGPCLIQCMNGGSCFLNAHKQPKCRCQPNYGGDRCEIDQCRDYCKNGGTCTPSPTGWIWKRSLLCYIYSARYCS